MRERLSDVFGYLNDAFSIRPPRRGANIGTYVDWGQRQEAINFMLCLAVGIPTSIITAIALTDIFNPGSSLEMAYKILLAGK